MITDIHESNLERKDWSPVIAVLQRTVGQTPSTLEKRGFRLNRDATFFLGRLAADQTGYLVTDQGIFRITPVLNEHFIADGVSLKIARKHNPDRTWDRAKMPVYVPKSYDDDMPVTPGEYFDAEVISSPLLSGQESSQVKRDYASLGRVVEFLIVTQVDQAGSGLREAERTTVPTQFMEQ